MPFIKRTHKAFHRCDSSPMVWSELENWYGSVLGQELAHSEKQQLDQILCDLFGYYLVHLGYPDKSGLLSTSRVSHQTRLVFNQVAPASRQRNHGLCGEPHALPFSSDSIDVVVLSHVLEYSNSPHEVLREVERTLIPEGHVVLLGFNPFSLWLFGRLFFIFSKGVPWCGHFLSVTRVKDWLALLGFDIVNTQYYFFRPPFQHAGLMRKLGLFEKLGKRLWPILGGGYVVVARKRVETLTPIPPRWKTRRKIVATGLAEPMLPHADKPGQQP